MECKEYFADLSGVMVSFLESTEHRFQIHLHYHNGYEIFLFERAVAQLLVNHTIYDIQDGDILLINPFIMHTAYQLLPGFYKRYCINVASSDVDQSLLRYRLDSLLKSINRKPLIHLKATDYNPLTGWRCSSIYAIYARKDPLWQEKLLAELALLLADIVSADQSRPDISLSTNQQSAFRDRRIVKLLSFIDEHFREELSLSDLEKRFFTSRYHICRLFKKETGLTISQYVNRKKVSLAQQILNDPDISIADACRASGFNFAQHFTSVFRSITGFTPSEYQKNRKEQLRQW